MFKIYFQAKRVEDIGNEGENKTVKQHIKLLLCICQPLLLLLWKDTKTLERALKWIRDKHSEERLRIKLKGPSNRLWIVKDDILFYIEELSGGKDKEYYMNRMIYEWGPCIHEAWHVG